MISSIPSAALASGIMLGLFSIGLTGHVRQAESISVANVLDGSAQTAYESRFDDANILQASAVNAIGTIKYALFGQASEGVIVGADGWLFTAEELEVGRNFEANITSSAARLAGVVDKLEAKGVTVVPVIVPDKSEIYADKLGVARPDVVASRRALFEEALDAQGTTYLDVQELLAGARAEGEVFIKDDTHWSPLGSRKVAQAVGDQLADVALTRAAAVTTKGTEMPYDGDLLTFVPTGPFRSIAGPQQLTIQTFQTDVEIQGGLFDAPDVEVALIGTSFSARQAFHFEGFLKQALQADVVNFAQEGQGPFAPMDAFLASEFFQTTPPKVVIWEVPVRYVSKDQ